MDVVVVDEVKQKCTTEVGVRELDDQESEVS